MSLSASRRPVLEEFEPRILYAADFAPLVLAGLADVQLDAQGSPAAAMASHEIAFVDQSVPDAQALIDDLQAQARAGRAIEVVVVAAGDDGLARVGETLAARSGVTAVHLLGHGSDGVMQLGASRLDAGTLLARAGELAAWASALGADADLLLYGCDVAAQADGRQFMADLAALTGADVAASDDLTGAAQHGGDWVLEQHTGRIESATALSVAQQQQWQGTLTLLARETFSNSGNLNGTSGGSGWATAWTGSGSKIQVTGSGLENPGGDLVTQGGSATLTSSLLLDAVVAERNLSATLGGTGTTSWLSFIVRPESGLLGDYMGLQFGSSSATVGFAGYSQGNFIVNEAGASTAAVVPGLAATSGVEAMLVVKIDHQAGNDVVTLWVNPTPGLAAPDSPNSVSVTGMDLGSFTRIAIAGGTAVGNNKAQLDEIRIGQTYADVAPSDTANAPTITSGGGADTAAFSVAENTTTVTKVTAADIDSGTTLTYSIAGGADAARFTINASDGSLAFALAPNFDAPADAGANNVYDVVVRASDGALSDTQALAVTVTNVNEAPVITSHGGGGSAAVSLAENQAAVGTVTANDTDAGATLTYSVDGGADAALFSIDAATGALAFVAPPDFETRSDSGTDNVYDVTVKVSDGTLSDSQALAITITDVDEAPVAGGDAYTLLQDTPRTVPAATGLLANDGDPEGGALSIVGFTAPAHGTLSLVPAAVSAITNLSQNAAADTRADWSPSGSKIAFDSARNGNNEIYVMNADGSGLVRLTTHGADDSQAAWSPDGSKIAFMSNRSGSYEVWVMNASDGSGLVQLTVTGSAVSGQPAWSPDGTQIAFTSDRGGGGFNVYVMSASGSGVTRLTTAAGDDAEPVWSPDGTQIAFSSTRDGNSEIYVMNADGSGQTRLTNHTSLDRAPTWSPDGTKIAFMSDRSGTAQVYVMDANGAQVTEVTSEAAGVSFPDWSARGLVFTLSNEVQSGALNFPGGFIYTPDAGYTGSDTFSYTVADAAGQTHSASVALTVSPHTAPTIMSNGGGASAAVSVVENQWAVTTVNANDTDLPAQTLVYSISGGADAARFAIDSATGALTFVAAPDREAPTDAGADNVYNVTVRVSDGTLADTQSLAVTVTDAVEALAATGEQRVNTTVADNQATALETRGSMTAVAMAPSGDHVVVWSSQNQDGGGWGIYGQRLDRQGNPIGGEFLVNQTTVDDQRWATVAMDNAGRFVVSWTAYNQDGTTLSVYARTYAADGSASSAEFRVHTTATGDQHNSTIAIDGSGNFIVVWQGEGPGDADGIFARRFSVGGAAIDATEFLVNTDTSRGHFDAAVSMNPSGAFSVVWDDTVGAHLRRFNSAGVALGAEVTVAPGTSAGDAAVAVAADGSTTVVWRETVGDRNVYLRRYDASGAPLASAVQVNTTASGDQVSPSIAMHTDGSFIVTWEGNGSGDASGVYARRYDAAGTAQGAEFLVNQSTTGAQTQASVAMLGLDDFAVVWSGAGPGDSSGVFTRQFGTLNVAPVITSNGGGATAAPAVLENGTAVTTVSATDLDTTQTLVYAISGGADAARFAIDPATGVLRFVTAPDFDAPVDAGGDNVYDVTVQVSDGALTDTQALAVTVGNVNEAPTLTSLGGGASVAVTRAENTGTVATLAATDPDAATTLAYAITGGADAARFSIGAASGVLQFVSGPDFEAPTDAGADNVYDVVVRVSDGTLTDLQAIAVTVTNANDSNPVISSNGGGPIASFSMVEDQTTATTVVATDADGLTPLVYSIAPGLDAALFTIDADTGVLSFATAPDFEAPTDSNGNNIYDVVVQVSDGTRTDAQLLLIVVTSANDAPVITSNGGGANAAVSVAENQTTVATITASDADAATTLAYAIVGGADAALFSIDAATGVLAFITAPNFEAPVDAGVNNVYDVIVQASDGTLTDTQSLAVTVSNLNEAPVITSHGGGAGATVNVMEMQTVVGTVTATDADAATTLTYTIVGGADAASFGIDAATGALAFVAAPDFEAPGDADANNVYDVLVRVSDGALTDTQALAVRVVNTNQAPVFDAGASAAVALPENRIGVVSVTASDADVGSTLSYRIVGGADGDRFTIDAATGALQFVAAPNFEAPVDADRDNVYAVTVEVSDGALADLQDLAVTVTDAAEAPVVTANALTVAEGAGAPPLLASSDEDTAPAQRVYTVSGVVGGRFEFVGAAGTAVTQFTQADIDAAQVRFVHDGGELAPAYGVSLSDGGLATGVQAAGIAYTRVNDLPAPGAPDLGAIDEDTPRTVTAAELLAGASDADGDAVAVATLRVGAGQGRLDDLGGGTWQFTPTANWNGSVRFDLTLGDGSAVVAGTAALTVRPVDDAPTIVDHSLTLHGEAGGGATTLVLVAADPDTSPSALVYAGSAVVGGQFESLAAPGLAIDRFTQAEVDAGSIRFVLDGSGTPPTYALQLTDGVTTTAGSPPSVVVDPAPAPETAPQTGASAANDDLVPPATDTAPATATASVPAASPAAAPATDREAGPTSAASTPPPASDSAAGLEGSDTLRADDTTPSRRTSDVSLTPVDAPSRGTHRAEPAGLPIEALLPLDTATAAVEIAVTGPTDAQALDLAGALRESSLAQALAPLRRESDEARLDVTQITVGGTAVSASLSVGYVLWLARGGVLMASVLAALPAWASLDPLPVLGQVNRKSKGPSPGQAGDAGDDDDDDDIDAVEQLFSKPQAGAAGMATASPEVPR